MKFCKFCGNKMQDDDIFCNSCGKRFEENNVSANNSNQGVPDQNMSTQNTAPAVKKSFLSKFSKKQLIIGAVAIVAVVVAFIIYNTLSKRVNPLDYIEVEYSGYDTAGTATVDLDETGFIKAVLKAQGIKVDSLSDVSDLTGSKKTKATVAVSALLYGSDFSYTLDKSSDLTNGDTVKVKIECSKALQKELGVTIVTKEKSYKVSDLKETKTINPFDYVDVKFSGTSPNAKVSVNNNASSSEDSFIRNISFKADKTSSIKEGDTITVTVNTTEGSALKKGYKFSETSKTYKCENVDKYVTSFSQIPADKVTLLQKDAKDKIEAYFGGINSRYGVAYKDLKVEGTYMLTGKSKNSDNKLYIIYSAKVSAFPESTSYKTFEDTKVYFPVCMTSVLLKANGDVSKSNSMSIAGSSLNYGSYDTLKGYTDGENMYKELITAVKDNYTYEVNGDVTSFGK